tara:strand:- start:989 stop:1201 length:213 start_codon:yes stop_codon:yes gene_type:complete
MFDMTSRATKPVFERITPLSQFPKRMSVKGPFGRTALVECEAGSTSATFKQGDTFILSKKAMKRHYGCSL